MGYMSYILVGLLAAALSGSLGYYLSWRFWNTQYSATNTNGDFGAPRGGFFLTLGGALLSMMFFAYFGKYFLPPETLGLSLIVSMIVGSIGGFVGMIRGQRGRGKTDEEPKDKPSEPKDDAEKKS